MIKTYRGLVINVAAVVDNIVFNISQSLLGPTKYLIISKHWNWIAVHKVIEAIYIFADLKNLQPPYLS